MKSIQMTRTVLGVERRGIARRRTIAAAFLAAVAAGGGTGHGYDWLQFNGDSRHGGNNALEKTIGSSNVATLVRIFQATLPSVCDGAPAYLGKVPTSSGRKDLIFCVTMAGDLVALDARTGGSVWTKSNPAGSCKINNGTNVCYTTSSPAIDPNRLFVYSYGLDGMVHRYRVGSGLEITGGGWPQLATAKPFDEKGSSNLATATGPGGNPFLYVCNGGYPGDRGDYQGHVTTINLSSGVQGVFNAACSDQTVHFQETPGTPDCAHLQTAIWARAGAVYDPDTSRLFVVTGNGDYDGNASGHDWGDSVLALHPSGTGSGGNPIDAYTPANFQHLEDVDADLGSTAPAVLPAAGFTGRLGLQSGKDAILRLIRLDNLSGHGGPGFTAGELQTLGVPQGGGIFSTPAVWVRPSDGSTWVFVANGSGTSGLRLSVTNGVPALAGQWTKGGASFSPLVANGILYGAGTGVLRALSPVTGDPLWSDTSSVGSIHWESPVVANGFVYLADGARHLTAWAPSLFPVSIAVDSEAASGTSSNVDRILEPGESVEIAPSWKNNGASPAAPTGTLTAFTGPGGASYTVGDASASYVSIQAGGTGSCQGGAAGCYRVAVSNPATRPAAHWDATATETLSDGSVHDWTVHIGRSFSDVPADQPFYAFVETLWHGGVTAGCGTGTFCPGDTVTRGQMAAFVARSEAGGDANVPPIGQVPGVGRYACGAGGNSLFSDLSPTDVFCPHVHWLAAAGQSFGCTEQPSIQSTWCPSVAVDRGGLARILARAMAGSDDGVPSKRSDPGNGRGYDCTNGLANAFSDVPDSNGLCRYIYFIWSNGVIDGFGDGTYGPGLPVSRDQMAKFLVNAFALTPY